MRLLISDANILIDMEAGALMETLFQLGTIIIIISSSAEEQAT